MQRSRTLVFVGLLTLAGSSWSQNAPHAAGSKAVLALEEKWISADKAGDGDFVATLLAENYVNTMADGSVLDKEKTVSSTRDTRYTSEKFEDLKTSTYGHVVVVTGGSRGKGTDRTGKPFEEHLRFTDIWIRTAGQWQCVASQYTNLAK